MKKRPTYLQSLIYALHLCLLATGTSASTSVSRPLRLLVQHADQSLWLYPLDGGAGRQLTPSLTPSADVVIWSLSPDQQWLAYIQMKNWRKADADRGKALLLNVVTGEKRVLLDAMLPAHYNAQIAPSDNDRAIIEGTPVWSKDSQRFTLISDHTGIVSLYVYNLRTANLRLLTQGQHNIAWPQWSPDEQYILYNEIEAFGTGAGPNGGALWVAPSIGPDVARRLSPGDQAFEKVTRWLDNTHLLTHISSFDQRRWEDNIVDLTTGKHTPFTAEAKQPSSCLHFASENKQIDLQPAPSEGAWLFCNVVMAPQGPWAYALLDGTTAQPSQFYLVNINSKEKRLLTEKPSPNPAAFDMDWSPDGQFLIWFYPDTFVPAGDWQEIGSYALWAVQIKQKQPFLLANQVALWGKHRWLK